MPTTSRQRIRANRARSRRVGRVTVYRRVKIWYIYYLENKQRIRRRVGPSADEAKQLAAQVNAQLASGVRAALSLEPLTLADLRRRWLDHHEHVLRSSTATIRRYRAATDHLLRFVDEAHPIPSVDRLTVADVEAFVQHLRTTEVAPNGHPNTTKRRLRDKGVVFILESCRAMLNFAAKHRCLPPYHDNPFAQIALDRIPVEDAKPIGLFTPKQEADFLEACDGWQFPVFLTMAFTGVRPGELVHLLLPDDVDLANSLIHVRNKPDLGWRTKTRNERDIPIIVELREVLRIVVGDRSRGPLFVRRRFGNGRESPLYGGCDRCGLAETLMSRTAARRKEGTDSWTRVDDARVARQVWRDAGTVKEAVLRVEFMKVTAKCGLPHASCPKMLRHLFATCLQDANVDPLIRQELMGHRPTGPGSVAGGLGMTALYTHTRPETRCRQLEEAMRRRPAVAAAREWLATRGVHVREDG